MKRCGLCIIALTVEMCGANAFAQPTLPVDSHGASVESTRASRAETDDESVVASKRKTWVEVWGYHSGQGHDSATNSLQGRLYHSFPIGRSGAQAVTRLDTSINSTSGPKYTGGGGGAFNPGNTRWTLVGYTPEVAQDLTFGGGFRLIMPTGYNNPPYSSAQWAMGPQIAMTYSPKNAGKFSFFRRQHAT